MVSLGVPCNRRRILLEEIRYVLLVQLEILQLIPGDPIFLWVHQKEALTAELLIVLSIFDCFSGFHDG